MRKLLAAAIIVATVTFGGGATSPAANPPSTCPDLQACLDEIASATARAQIFATSTTTTSSSSTTSTSSSTTTSTAATTTTSTAATTTTTVAPTTTTTKPAGTVYWSAGHETGNLNEWIAGGGGNQENSGSFTNGVTTDIAHTGTHSLKMTIDTSAGSSGVRMFRWAEPRVHRDAYYSAWLYIPTAYRLTGSQQWWNVMQFKSRYPDGTHVDPLWAFYANQDATGLYLRAGWGWGGVTAAGPHAGDGTSGKWFEQVGRMYLPVGRWVHLEAFLHESKDFDGQLTFWQDGVRLFDLTGIRTSYTNCNFNSWCADNEWSTNLYADALSPNPATLFVDDAAISAGFIG